LAAGPAGWAEIARPLSKVAEIRAHAARIMPGLLTTPARFYERLLANPVPGGEYGFRRGLLALLPKGGRSDGG
jgi:hypothetical protein